MKKLKLLAISDLHLGEPEGLLNNQKGVPNIQDIAISKIAQLAQGDSGLENGIEELILIGDIVDISEATEHEAYSNTKIFFTALLQKVQVDKIVYVIGNHDHHLWVEMLEAHCKKNYKECKPKTGVIINNPNAITEKCLPSDYKGKAEAHYPFYKVKTDNACFLFDHGHIFSSTLNKWAGDVKTIEEMEEKTWEFMESIWFQGGKAPWMYRFREKVYDWARWFSQRASHPARGVQFKEDSTPVFDDDLRGRLVKYLEEMHKLSKDAKDDFHLVFGHTHYGGRVLREDRKIRVNGRFITLWNTGGWLVPSEVFSPDAYIFYLERTSLGLKPQAYKLVAKDGGQEGDYDRAVLEKIVKGIG